MSAQTGATSAAVRSVVGRLFEIRFGALTGLAFAAMTLGGCVLPTVPLVGANPADPGVKVAGVGYRSSIAPYTSLRPTAPSGWKEQNQRVTPTQKSGQ